MSKKLLTYGLVVVLVLVAIALSFVGGFLFGHTTQRGQSIPIIGQPKSLQLIQTARDAIEQLYVGKTSDKQLEEAAVNGMVQSLHDPYSEYITPKQFGIFQQHTTGEFSGVGVTLGMRDHKLTVIHPLAGTPAMRAGIKPGDIIVKIDGAATANMSISVASEKIRGPEGTKVALAIKRGKASKLMTFNLTRATITLPSVQSEMAGPGLGYVDVHSFTPSTGGDFEKAIKKLAAKGAKGVVVDLRDNPGGLVESAVEVGSIFVPNGIIVSIKGHDNQPQTMSAIEGYHTKMALVVLVNGDSASASEIFAGAIQDRKRGLVAGTRTFGKASVQTVENLPNGGALKITSAHYFTPKGRLIQKIGIKPDIEVKAPKGALPFSKTDAQKTKAIEILKQLLAGRLKP